MLVGSAAGTVVSTGLSAGAVSAGAVFFLKAALSLAFKLSRAWRAGASCQQQGGGMARSGEGMRR